MRIDWDVTVNNGVIQRIVQRMETLMQECRYRAAVQILNEMEHDLKDIYNRVIKEFYSDYAPEYYDRTGSLYSLLELDYNGDRLNWGFNTDNATAFERGGGSDGLYEHVFRQGWHGGATGTDHKGYTATIPSWRSPYGLYSNWGSVADRAPRSPLEAWEQEVDAYKTDFLPQRYAALYRHQLKKAGFK